MVRSMVLGILMSAVAAGSIYAQTPAEPAAAAQTAQSNARLLTSDAGLFLIFIKADKTADFEAVMAKVKESLLKSDKPERKQQAASWKVFKSADPAGANALYVITVDPAVKGADYDFVNILTEVFPSEAQFLYNQYVASLAQGLNIVNLTLVSHFGQ